MPWTRVFTRLKYTGPGRTPAWLVLLLLLLMGLPAYSAATDSREQNLKAAYDRLDELQKQYLLAYQIQFQTGKRFKTALRTLTPPPWHAYTPDDLAVFHQKMQSLYQEHPQYRDLPLAKIVRDRSTSELAKFAGITMKELGRFEGAQDLAAMAGLPLRELAVCRRLKGNSGLQDLVFSVKNLANRQWVAWRFFVMQNQVAQKELFTSDVRGFPQLAQLRQAFIDAIASFNRAADRLGRALHRLMGLEPDPAGLNRIAAKAHAFEQMFKVVGRIDIFGSRAGKFPLNEARPEQYPQAAALARRLGVPFGDLAYIQRRSGISGLRQYMKRLVWIRDKKGLEALVRLP